LAEMIGDKPWVCNQLVKYRRKNMLLSQFLFWLDGQFLTEQMGRTTIGLPVAFLGTAGIWRRTCLEQLQGWSSDTQMEDHDQSYRAQIQQWRMLLLPNLIVPGELPSTLDAFRTQQARWSKGIAQVLRKLILPLWRARLPLRVKAAGTLHLLGYSAHVLLVLLMLLRLPLALLGIDIAAFDLPLLLAAFGPVVLYGANEWRLRGLRSVLCHLPVFVLLWLGLTPTFAANSFSGLVSTHTHWPRTPKWGSTFSPKMGPTSTGAFVLALLAGAASLVAVAAGLWHLVLFLVVFTLAQILVGLGWQQISVRLTYAHPDIKVHPTMASHPEQPPPAAG
jgi:cellulose synthase/poly-beta-1,6-N-acetylglucosamine synthase-like glycosyltransferase